jgi:hypothetical protein
MSSVTAETPRLKAAVAGASRLDSIADSALKTAAKSWFILSAVGQCIFALYVAGFYGGAAVSGNLEKWNTFLPNGYIPGDMWGNLQLGMHLLLAVTIILQGPLQFIPRIRSRAPSFHRWNGRIYMMTAIVISLAAIYLKFSRELHEHMNIVLGFTLNGILIAIFAVVAWRHALARNFSVHSRWALRTYTMVSAIWIYRVGFVAWFMINMGPVGHTDDFKGPFDAFWGFGYVVLPLLVLEAYFYIKDRAGPRARLGLAGLLFLITAVFGISTLVATIFFWIPSLTPQGVDMTAGPLHM